MGMDGRRLTPRLREGDWTCSTHGRISPLTDTLVPACPQCGAMALRAVRPQRGADYLVHAEPSPGHCANGHPYGPNRVLLGFHACDCPPVVAAGASGHRTWKCGTCDDVRQWPPCEAAEQ